MSTQRTVVNQMVSQFGHGPDALAALMESALQNGSIDAGERNALYDEAGKLFRMAHELVGVAVMVYGE